MRKPWWVMPAAGAALGTLAVVATVQGSLASAHVALPAGPQLSSGVPLHRAPAISQVAAIVTASLPVVTQTGVLTARSPDPGLSTPDPSSPVSKSRSDAGSGSDQPEPAVPAASAPSPGADTQTPSTQGSVEDTTTTTAVPPATTTTTRAAPTTTTTQWGEPGDN